MLQESKRENYFLWKHFYGIDAFTVWDNFLKGKENIDRV